MKFGWRDSATSMAGADDPGNEVEVDQEFEDACLALAMSDVPQSSASEPPRFDDPRVDEHPRSADELDSEADTFTVPLPPETRERFAEAALPPLPRSFVVATAGELAEDLPAEPVGRTTVQDLPSIPEVARPSSTLPVPPAPQPTALPGGGAHDDDVNALHRELDVLRGELVSLRSRHAQEIAQLQSEVKAAQAREAQTVIAAQLAEDELKAVRADHVSARQQLTASHGQQASGQADLAAAQEAFDQALATSARDLATSRAEADALRQMVEELQAGESERVARWNADRQALQGEIRTASESSDHRVRALEAMLAEKDNDLRVARESAIDRLRQLEDRLAAKESELAVTQQELLDAEMRRAEEAASFMAALHKQG